MGCSQSKPNDVVERPAAPAPRADATAALKPVPHAVAEEAPVDAKTPSSPPTEDSATKQYNNESILETADNVPEELPKMPPTTRRPPPTSRQYASSRRGEEQIESSGLELDSSRRMLEMPSTVRSHVSSFNISFIDPSSAPSSQSKSNAGSGSATSSMNLFNSNRTNGPPVSNISTANFYSNAAAQQNQYNYNINSKEYANVNASPESFRSNEVVDLLATDEKDMQSPIQEEDLSADSNGSKVSKEDAKESQEKTEDVADVEKETQAEDLVEDKKETEEYEKETSAEVEESQPECKAQDLAVEETDTTLPETESETKEEPKEETDEGVKETKEPEEAPKEAEDPAEESVKEETKDVEKETSADEDDGKDGNTDTEDSGKEDGSEHEVVHQTPNSTETPVQAVTEHEEDTKGTDDDVAVDDIGVAESEPSNAPKSVKDTDSVGANEVSDAMDALVDEVVHKDRESRPSSDAETEVEDPAVLAA